MNKQIKQIKMNDELAHRIGEELAKVFHLKRDKQFPDRYRTEWGTKTAQGVARSALRILLET